MGAKKISFANLSDNQLDKYPLLKIIKIVEKYIRKLKPKTIYTHYENDLNIDHQIVNKAVITATRPQKKSSVKNIFFLKYRQVLSGKLTQNQKYSIQIGLRIFHYLKIKNLKH